MKRTVDEVTSNMSVYEENGTAILIPEEYNSKDISDLVRDHGIETAKEFLKNTIEG